MHVAVIGAGYVGLVTGACLAEMGHHVRCLEIDQPRLTSLLSGRLPIYEPGLDELVARNVAAGRLSFHDAYPVVLKGASHAFIAVPTPPLDNGHADTYHVFSAARSVIEHAADDVTIVVKSTVPVGTGDDIARVAIYMERPLVKVVSNPEFLRQGSAVNDFFEPDRIVIGADPADAGHDVGALYSGLDAPIVYCTRRSAELAKYAANALLATRISFMNEVAAVCDATGADIEDVARIVGADARIGPHFLRAGLGWGGSCFPKDVLALAAMAAQHNSPSPILDAVLEINGRQRDLAADWLLEAVAGVDRPTVAILGLAFKPDTDDLRGAPAVDIIRRLAGHGVRVRAHDPVAMEKARLVAADVEYATDAYEAAIGADAVLLATEWREYLHLDWERVGAAMRGRTVIDGRNVLDGEQLRALGFRYLAFGRGGRAEHRLLEISRSTGWPLAEAEGRSLGAESAERQPVADSAA